MKAYMSQPGAGPMFLEGDVLASWDGITFPYTGPRNDVMAGEWAELEARRILADTEPQVDGEAHFTTLALLPFCGPRTGYGMGAALADALARFVAD